MGTGVPFVLKNIPADHSHKNNPAIRKGVAIAALRGMEINFGNPQYRSRKKEVTISSNTIQKKIKPTSGVRISRIIFVPVAILYMKFIICSRIDFIFIPLIAKLKLMLCNLSITFIICVSYFENNWIPAVRDCVAIIN